MERNSHVRIRNLPREAVDETHFKIVEGAMPALGRGEVLDLVLGWSGWQLFSPEAASQLEIEPIAGLPLSAYLGAHLHDRARADLRAWLRGGVFRRRGTISKGLENAPGSFVAMFNLRGQGKTLVQLV